jgi:radical SAM superfamily enzyme with C-terminal helix-hairpin-helix motif
MRSISGVEIGLDINTVSQQQLESIPGIGKKAAWRLISSRAKASRSSRIPFDSVEMAFEMAQVDLSPIAEKVLSI